MKESDWKVFKKIKEKGLEKYCVQCLAQYKAVIDDETKTPHERYLLHYQLVEKNDENLALLFDGHSRSNAWLQLLGIRAQGLAEPTLVEKLTEDFQHETDPKRHIR
jgi:hypothetical protein